MGGCLFGCLVVIAVLILLPFFPIALLALVVYVVGRLLLGYWQSDRPLRTKRALTGLLFFPAGAYFLYRYTRYPARLKQAYLVAAAVVPVLIVHGTSQFLPLVALLGAVFLALFWAGTSGMVEAAGVKIASARAAGPERLEVPADDLRRLLEIEEAGGAAERQLLLAREFNRLATEVCGASLLDRASWPDRHRLAVLKVEVGLLKASAAETPLALSDPSAAVVDQHDLRAAIHYLREYVGLMLEIDRQPHPHPELMRRLARQRGRIQAVQDDLIARLQES